MAATRNKAPRKSAGIEHVKVSSSSAKKRAGAPKKDGVGAKSTSAAKTASGKARAKITPVAAKASPSKASAPARTPAAQKPLSETATRAVAKTAKTVARAVNAVEKAVSGVKKTVGAVKKGVSKRAAAAAAAPKATAKRAAKSAEAAAATARGAAQSAGAKAGKAAKAVTSAAKAAGKAAAKTAGKGAKAAGREPEVKAAPKVGSRAPDFELAADDGSKVSLASLRGKNVIIYFYPRDMTPGCTVEACGFRDHYDEIEEKNAVVLGVSRDSIASHVKFKEKENLPFPLLSDPDAEVIASYGSWGEKTFMGKKSMGILRTTVLIDGDGKVRKVYPKVSTQDHATEVLRDLAALEA